MRSILLLVAVFLTSCFPNQWPCSFLVLSLQLFFVRLAKLPCDIPLDVFTFCLHAYLLVLPFLRIHSSLSFEPSKNITFQTFLFFVILLFDVVILLSQRNDAHPSEVWDRPSSAHSSAPLLLTIKSASSWTFSPLHASR